MFQQLGFQFEVGGHAVCAHGTHSERVLAAELCYKVP